MMQDEAIETALKLLEPRVQDVDYGDKSFLESILAYGVHTPKQRVRLARIVDKLLPEKLLGAEILGQERLL